MTLLHQKNIQSAMIGIFLHLGAAETRTEQNTNILLLTNTTFFNLDLVVENLLADRQLPPSDLNSAWNSERNLLTV